MRVRRATLDDLELLLAFTKQEAIASDGMELGEETTRGLMAALSCQELCTYYIVEDSEKVVGSIALAKEWSDWRAAFFLYVAFVFVVPEERGRGVFAEMWQAILQAIDLEPYKNCEARLLVNKDNSSAIRAYEKSGFQLLPYLTMAAPLPQIAAKAHNNSNKKTLVECCCDSLQSVKNAIAAKVDRIELCSALSLGGITPSVGFVRAVRKIVDGIALHVLIRPRDGDFDFDDDEFEAMRDDIVSLRPYVDGFVVGILKENTEIDVQRTRVLVQLANGKPCTFNRAFDLIPSNLQLNAISMVNETGCSCLLTSGGATSAVEGRHQLNILKENASAIDILAGGGINASNIEEFLNATGILHVHGSFSVGSAAGNLLSSSKVKCTDVSVAEKVVTAVRKRA